MKQPPITPEALAAIVEALESLPRSADRYGGAEALCCAFATLLDHTLLKPDARPDEVRRLCDEARRYTFATAVVNPCYVPLAVSCLRGSAVRVGSVAGFPLGGAQQEVKLFEARHALRDGAREVDMVIHVGALKSGDLAAVEDDVRAIAKACHARGALLKVILECALLNDNEKRTGARAAVRAGADFVKTSTGFGPPGATAEDVALLRATVGPKVGVKASGGIRTLADAVRMLSAGASRIGTSSGVAIMEELRALVRL